MTTRSVPQVRVVEEERIRGLSGPRDAVEAMRTAFTELATGEAEMPAPMAMTFPAHDGELHVKAAHLRGAPTFAVKVADGFAGNAGLGLPTSTGLVLVFDATTGFPLAVLLDNGFLTNLRTGAVGALAADLLAAPTARRVAVLGSGTQARFQLDALLQVRDPDAVTVWSRNRAHAEEFATWVRQGHGDIAGVRVADDVEDAVRDADVVITTTPARSPLLRADWVADGTHVTAVGSDMPGKQELDAALLSRAAVVVADSVAQACTQGEVRSAVEAGTLDAASVVELSHLVAGMAGGRTSSADVTVADLTGLGIADAAIAQLVLDRIEG